MRIGFVTQWYPPEHGTGLSSSIAESLVDAGHTVDVLTGFPNYPTGRLYEGFKVRPYLRETVAPRLTLHRAPLFPSHDTSAVGRTTNYTSFALGSALVAQTSVPRPDAWLVYSSPATAALATLIPGPKSAPTALLIQDLWPDSVFASGLLHRSQATKPVEKVLGWYCAATYRRARRIGVISPSMADVLIARGVPKSKIRYTPNWALNVPTSINLHPYSRRDRAQLGLPVEGTIFLYAGNLGPLQDLAQLVRNFPVQDTAQLVLMGDGIVRSQLMDLARPRANVHMMDAVTNSEVARYIANVDVLVVSLADSPLLRATMPSKVQSFLAHGRPILVHGAGDVADVVLSSGAGATARPGYAKELHSAVLELVQADVAARREMGRRARERYFEEFDRSVGVSRLLSMMNDIVAKGIRFP